MYEWLISPIDPDRVHQVGFFISWHGRFMSVAWAGLIPMGIILARYFKVMPTQQWPQYLDNPTWWHAHRVFQYAAAAFVAIGSVLILYRSTTLLDTELHRRIGWVVVGLTGIQAISGILRGSKGGPTALAPDGSLSGDHYDMSQYRVMFEYYHKFIGYILLVVAIYSVISGMWIANAYNWMWLALAIWWVFLFFLVIYLQRKGACFDTYQAIWGKDERLIGNQRKPIGFGINTGTPWKK